jgi:DNA-binding MarR family transcriptional regulator
MKAGHRKWTVCGCTHDAKDHTPHPSDPNGRPGPCRYGTGIGTTVALCMCTGFHSRRAKGTFASGVTVDEKAVAPFLDPGDLFIAFMGAVASLSTAIHAQLVAAKDAPPKKDPFVLTPRLATKREDLRLETLPKLATPAAARAAAPKKVAEKGERKVLTALAQHPRGLTSEQLAVFTEYASTARGEYLAALQKDGRVSRTGDFAGRDARRSVYEITVKGLEWLGSFEKLPTGDALLTYWTEKLKERESTVLVAIASVYPHGLTLGEIGTRTDYRPTSVGEATMNLVRRRLVVKDGREVRAVAELFGSGEP